MSDELTVTIDDAYDERIALLVRTINAQAKAIDALVVSVRLIEDTLTRGTSLADAHATAILKGSGLFPERA
jgi:hypothetical protein